MKKTHIFILLFTYILLSSFMDIDKNDKKLLFKSQIGPKFPEITVHIYDLNINRGYSNKTIEIALFNQEKEVFSDTLIIEMDNEPMINLADINGDEIKDLLIEYLRPGKGGNNVTMAYLFNSRDFKLDKISNSIYFPNLSFDYKLNSISSFRFYGESVQLDYLEIKSDTLSPKYQIIKEEQMIYVKQYVGGKWIKRKGFKLKSDDIIIPEILQLEPNMKIKNAS